MAVKNLSRNFSDVLAPQEFVVALDAFDIHTIWRVLPVLETGIFALIFTVLLGFEWRYRFSSIRLVTAILTLIVLLFAQPNYTNAARRVSVASPEERVTRIGGSPISEYESGVATMVTAIDEVQEEHSDIRLIALGVLFWLACSPVLRSTPGLSTERKSKR